MEEEGIEKEKFYTTTKICVAVSGVNVSKRIFVTDHKDWYSEQFEKFGEEQEEMQKYFVHRSSSKCCWFVCSNDVPNISRVSEGGGNTSCSDSHRKLPINV